MLRRWSLIGLLAASLFAQAKSPSLEPKAPAAEWTLVFFMDSDTNLESAQNINLHDLMAGADSDQVNIICLVDRSKEDDKDGYSGDPVGQLPNWHGAKLVRISKGKIESLEDWGEVNTADPEPMVKLFDKAVAIAPAQKYCLVLSDHGASWPGLNSDESAGGGVMSLKQLESGLKQIADKHGRLEMLHFDDCLMGCAETYQSVAPYTKFVTASEEVVPGLGTDYKGLLQKVNGNPAMTGREFGTALVHAFQDFYAKSSDEQLRDTAKNVTMALIDCDQVPALVESIKAFTEAQNALLKRAYRPEFIKIARARKDSIEYGKGSGDEPNTGTIDLVDYCNNLAKAFNSGPLVDAGSAVIEQVGKTVIVSVHGEALPRSHGVAIYFPDHAAELKGSPEAYDSTAFDTMTKWGASLVNLMTIKATDKQPPALAAIVVSANTIRKGSEVTFTSQINVDDLADAYFTIAIADEKDKIILGQIPASIDEQGKLSESWDGNWLYIHNGDEAVICPVDDVQLVDENDPEGDIVILVPMQIQRKGKQDWINVTATFVLDFAEDKVAGDLVYIFDESSAGKREINLRKGDTIRPVFLMIDGEGQEEYVSAEGKDFEVVIKEEDGLAVEEDMVPPGEYLMGFRVLDLSDNSAEDFKKVTVEE